MTWSFKRYLELLPARPTEADVRAAVERAGGIAGASGASGTMLVHDESGLVVDTVYLGEAVV